MTTHQESRPTFSRVHVSSISEANSILVPPVERIRNIPLEKSLNIETFLYEIAGLLLYFNTKEHRRHFFRMEEQGPPQKKYLVKCEALHYLHSNLKTFYMDLVYFWQSQIFANNVNEPQYACFTSEVMNPPMILMPTVSPMKYQHVINTTNHAGSIETSQLGTSDNLSAVHGHSSRANSDLKLATLALTSNRKDGDMQGLKPGVELVDNSNASHQLPPTDQDDLREEITHIVPPEIVCGLDQQDCTRFNDGDVNTPSKDQAVSSDRVLVTEEKANGKKPQIATDLFEEPPVFRGDGTLSKENDIPLLSVPRVTTLQSQNVLDMFIDDQLTYTFSAQVGTPVDPSTMYKRSFRANDSQNFAFITNPSNREDGEQQEQEWQAGLLVDSNSGSQASATDQDEYLQDMENEERDSVVSYLAQQAVLNGGNQSSAKQATNKGDNGSAQFDEDEDKPDESANGSEQGSQYDGSDDQSQDRPRLPGSMEQAIVEHMPPFASSIVHLYDRRINFDTMSSNASSYSLLRAWIQDDPDRISFSTDVDDILRIQSAPFEEEMVRESFERLPFTFSSDTTTFREQLAVRGRERRSTRARKMRKIDLIARARLRSRGINI